MSHTSAHGPPSSEPPTPGRHSRSPGRMAHGVLPGDFSKGLPCPPGLCTRVCVNVCICGCVHMWVGMYVCIHVCVCVEVPACRCICGCVHACMDVHVCVAASILLYLYTSPPQLDSRCSAQNPAHCEHSETSAGPCSTDTAMWPRPEGGRPSAGARTAGGPLQGWR